MKKLSILMIFGIVLFFSSCAKNDSEKNLQLQSLLTTGQLHNSILDKIAISPNFPNVLHFETFSISQKYIKTLYGQDIMPFANYRYSSKGDGNIFGEYTAQTVDLLKASTDANDFKKQSAQIENLIVNDFTIESNTKKVYLNTLSVLQESYFYWEKAYTDKKNPWHNLISDNYAAQLRNKAKSASKTADSQLLPFPTYYQLVDAIAYSNTYWDIYNGSNESTAQSVAATEGAYQSGIAIGNTMHIP